MALLPTHLHVPGGLFSFLRSNSADQKKVELLDPSPSQVKLTTEKEKGSSCPSGKALSVRVGVILIMGLIHHHIYQDCANSVSKARLPTNEFALCTGLAKQKKKVSLDNLACGKWNQVKVYTPSSKLMVCRWA